MAKMNMFLHDYTDSLFSIGDTFTKPGFAAEGAGLKRFDYVVANPMWNQDNYGESLYENDQWKRFEFGPPPATSADWGWLQHMYASLNDSGRAAVVLDTGAASRGAGSKSTNKASSDHSQRSLAVRMQPQLGSPLAPRRATSLRFRGINPPFPPMGNSSGFLNWRCIAS